MNWLRFAKRESSACAGIFLCLFCVSAVAEDAAARKKSAEATREEVVKKLGDKVQPGFNITADGPEATVYTYHSKNMTSADCPSMVAAEGFIAGLRKIGFTQLVCTDDGDARFAFDLVAASSTPEPAGKDAGARRSFVETVKQKLGSERDLGYSLSADGPDATIYAWNKSKITSSECSGMLTEDLVTNLRKYGFTQLVCTDGANARYVFDLTLSSASGSAINSVTNQPASVAPSNSGAVSQNCPEGTVRIKTSFGPSYCGQMSTSSTGTYEKTQAQRDSEFHAMLASKRDEAEAAALRVINEQSAALKAAINQQAVDITEAERAHQDALQKVLEAQALARGHRKVEAIAKASLTGRVFALTTGGDVKPALLAHVSLFSINNPIIGWIHARIQSSESYTAKVTAAYTMYPVDEESDLKHKTESLNEDCHDLLRDISEELADARETTELDPGFSPTYNVDTDEAGNFKIVSIRPGAYLIIARGQAGRSDVLWIEKVSMAGTPQTLRLHSVAEACQN